MPKHSVVYARMREALLACVGAIPRGKVVDIGTLATSLNIPARHAAFILSRLSADESDAVPWHRVVPRGGDFTQAKKHPLRFSLQVSLLRSEGFTLVGETRLAYSDAQLWLPPDTHRATRWSDARAPSQGTAPKRPEAT